MKIIGNIKKLYKTIKEKWLKLSKIIRIFFIIILILIFSYIELFYFFKSRILWLIFIFLAFMIYFIPYLLNKRFNRACLFLSILFFILFIIELTPYSLHRKLSEEMTYTDMKNSNISMIWGLTIFIFGSIFCAISFFIGKPFFQYSSTNKRQNIIIGIISFIPALFMIIGITFMKMNLKCSSSFLFLDTVPPHYNKVILSEWGNRGNGILLLKDNQLKKLDYNNAFLISPLSLRKWCGGLSSDTNHIVYCDEYSTEGIENIWLMKSNGEDKKQLTYNERVLISTRSSFPLFNSKNNKIAFVRYKIIYKQNDYHRKYLGLYIINIDGTREKQLVKPTILPGNWSWSPNGKGIYFIKNGNLWLVDVESGIQKQLTKDNRKYSSPIPAPDGTKLFIFIGENFKAKPCIFDVKKLKTTKVFSSIKIFRGLGNLLPIYYFIRWSIKGDRILFSYFDKKVPSNVKIGILNLLDYKITNLTSGETKDSWPIWYNKEEQIMFVRNGKEIWIINNDGSDTKKIFPK